MKPVATEDTNFTYKLPGGTSENDLPCERGRVNETPFVRSTWDFDVDEADLFKSTEGTLFLMVYGKGTHVRVHQRGEPSKKLALEVVSDDGEGTLYVVGAAGIAREEIVDAGLIDLMVFEVPTPPVAMWVQPIQQVETVDAEPAPSSTTRWILVVEDREGLDSNALAVKLEAVSIAIADQGLVLADMERSTITTDPEELDSPDTKGA